MSRSSGHGSDTSIQAYETVKPRITAMHRKILKFIRDHGGATCYEVELGLGMEHATASARINEMHTGKIGKDKTIPIVLVESGERRPTKSGCTAKVWIPGTKPSAETNIKTKARVKPKPPVDDRDAWYYKK